MTLVHVLQSPENLLCTAWEERSRRVTAQKTAAHSGVHSRVPKLRTTLAACLHMLSTDLCTARIDAWANTLETVGAVR
jgi:hypothetical protein